MYRGCGSAAGGLWRVVITPTVRKIVWLVRLKDILVSTVYLKQFPDIHVVHLQCFYVRPLDFKDVWLHLQTTVIISKVSGSKRKKDHTLMRRFCVGIPDFCHYHTAFKWAWRTFESFKYKLLHENFRPTVSTFQYFSQILMFTARVSLTTGSVYFSSPTLSSSSDHLTTSLRNHLSNKW